MLHSKRSGIFSTLLEETSHMKSRKELKEYIDTMRLLQKPEIVDHVKYKKAYTKQKEKLELEMLKILDLQNMNQKIVSIIKG